MSTKTVKVVAVGNQISIRQLIFGDTIAVFCWSLVFVKCTLSIVSSPMPVHMVPVKSGAMEGGITTGAVGAGAVGAPPLRTNRTKPAKSMEHIDKIKTTVTNPLLCMNLI